MGRALQSAAIILFAAIVAGGLATGDAAAQSGESGEVKGRLESVREAIEADRKSAEELARAAVAQARELQSLRAELRAAARAVQSHEAALDTIEAELAVLRGDAARKQGALEARRTQLGGTLAALQRLSLRPTAALLVSPGDPNDVVRSGLLLRTAVPEIARQAQILRDDIAELADLRNRIELRRVALQQAALDLNRDRGRLETLSNTKNDILQQTRGAQSAADARVSDLIREAQSLEELLSRLRDSTAAAAPQPQPRPGSPPADFVTPTLAPVGPSIASARGNLTPPAHGRVIQSFGDPTIAGPRARGVTWETRADASVVAPWDGRIAFAGPFRRFGQILIIDHGEGYHTLIAGLGRIEVQVGQWVLAGEPLGRTDNAANRPQGTSDGTKSGGQAARAEDRSSGTKLYVELRHDGEPINPLPWLAAQTNRTQG
ncbi:MAG: peptidoglycan DD-metalloendopeptidase family protein [Proteobacteria bacterium]|nr:peptidoglycan DD-metalloendopeptidase family protein [Pseudomonadota bacterium]